MRCRALAEQSERVRMRPLDAGTRMQSDGGATGCARNSRRQPVRSAEGRGSRLAGECFRIAGPGRRIGEQQGARTAKHDSAWNECRRRLGEEDQNVGPDRQRAVNLRVSVIFRIVRGVNRLPRRVVAHLVVRMAVRHRQPRDMNCEKGCDAQRGDTKNQRTGHSPNLSGSGRDGNAGCGPVTVMITATADRGPLRPQD